MYQIRNIEDLRKAYTLLRFALSEPCKLSASDPLIVELKHDIRKYVHRPERPGYVIQNDFDRAIFVFPLPVETVEEGKAYFMDNEYIYFEPSPYDCTGQTFTAWFHIVKKRGGIWAYHCVHRDV